LLLNLSYKFTGSARVNPMFMILEVLLIRAWRNSGWFGLDRLILARAWTSSRFGTLIGRALHKRGPVIAPAGWSRAGLA
jgi:hypothetical protein